MGFAVAPGELLPLRPGRGCTSTSTATTPTATTDDDPPRLVPNPRPPKKESPPTGPDARARLPTGPWPPPTPPCWKRCSPPPGYRVLITNQARDGLSADLRAAETDLDTAQATHRALPARLPLAQVNPGQQVLDIQNKAD